MAETAPATEELCQHIDAQRAFIHRDLYSAARKAAHCKEGTRAYNTAVAEIKRLQGELAKHEEVVRISGPKCGFCMDRGR
jgi:hypothetical protein